MPTKLTTQTPQQKPPQPRSNAPSHNQEGTRASHITNNPTQSQILRSLRSRKLPAGPNTTEYHTHHQSQNLHEPTPSRRTPATQHPSHTNPRRTPRQREPLQNRHQKPLQTTNPLPKRTQHPHHQTKASLSPTNQNQRLTRKLLPTYHTTHKTTRPHQTNQPL